MIKPMTQQEAESKYCPYAQGTCHASMCVAWIDKNKGNKIGECLVIKSLLIPSIDAPFNGALPGGGNG